MAAEGGVGRGNFFLAISPPEPKILVLLSAPVERFCISCMQEFFLFVSLFCLFLSALVLVLLSKHVESFRVSRMQYILLETRQDKIYSTQ